MSKVDWKRIVGTVAPTLATALGGPLAGVAVRTISQQLLGKDNATDEEVESAVLNGDPQTLVRLKEIDAEFKKFTVDAGIKLEEIAARDRDSARKREVDAHDSWTPRVLAAAFVLGWFVFQYYILRHIVPAEMREIVMRTLGTMDMGLGLILGYYFGSSASGKSKDETIATIAKMD